MANQSSKHALLIGINRYPNFDDGRQLKGCRNDVEMMAKILQEKYKFHKDNVTLIRDKQATQQGIRTAMNELVSRVGNQDIVVIHYSGHGSQMTDQHHDEASGKDNTIVPYDSGRAPHPNRDILDDEIHLWLAQLTRKTTYITLIFDCCRSGSIARDVFGDAERWVPADERPPDQLQWEITGSPLVGASDAERSRGSRDLGPSGWLALSEAYVLLAGCEDAESSWELTTDASEGRVTHGALTYFLNQELQQAGPGTTYRDVFERIKPLVTAKYPGQHPQIEGKQDRELFDTRNIEPLRFVTVTARNADIIRLAAGAAQGMTIGSQWKIYAQGTKWAAVQDGIAALGRAEITNVSAVSADARLTQVAVPDTVQVGCYAVEYAHNYGDMQLKVAILAPAGYEDHMELLKERLQASKLLHVIEDDDADADVRVNVIPPRRSVGDNDPLPQLGVVDKAVWVVINRDGRSATPAHAVDEASVLDLVYENLEKIARYRYTLALHNANPDHLLKNKVDFILKRQKEDSDWEAATAAEDGKVIFEADDRIAFEIVNRHTVPVYVSVLDFGLTGAVTLLHPPNRPSEKLEPGVHLVIGERDEDKIELWVPEAFQYTEGLETFKLFVTAQATDFSWMQQQTVRSIEERKKGLGSLFQQLFDLVYSGLGLRDARPVTPPPMDEWTTVERTFMLRKKVL